MTLSSQKNNCGYGQRAKRQIDFGQHGNLTHALAAFWPIGRRNGEFQAPKWPEIKVTKKREHQKTEAKHDVPANRRVFHAHTQ